MANCKSWRKPLGVSAFAAAIFFCSTLSAVIDADVAFGSHFTISDADAGVASFDKKPAIYLEGGSLGARAKKLKVLTTAYPADALECRFNVKVPSGTYTLTMDAGGDGARKILTEYFHVMDPILRTTEPRWGKAGERITLTGQYFGTSRPKLWMEYFDPAGGPVPGKFVKLNCSFELAKTFMDPETGTSSLVFKVPEKMPDVATLLYLKSPSGTCPIAFSNSPFALQENLETPMRDGVRLSGNLYTPTTDGPFPTLIFRTPYSKAYRAADPMEQIDCFDEKTVRNAVKRGYAVLMQDVRGRYASGGEYNPYQNEQNDGYDTIEWAAAQSWSTGEVGTFGLSYPGVSQWFSAIGTPPHLKAMVPAMVPSTMNQCVYFGGIFEIGWNGWSYKYMSSDIRTKNHLPGPQSVSAARREYYRLGGEDAFANYLWTFSMPYLKDTCQFYYDWIINQPYGDYYAFGDFRPHYAAVKAAVLNLSGWYDEAYGTEGATTNYLGLLASRALDADKRTKLLIGPWVHGVDATQSKVSGERKFPDNARIDYDSVVLDWLDYYVRGVENDVPNWPAVRVYQMEANGKGEWVSDTTWPLTGTQERALYLVPAQNGGNRGTLSFVQPTTHCTASSFVSNPAFPVRDTTEGTNFGAYNLAYLAETPGVLTFDSEKLKTDLRVIGQVKAEIHLSADAPDCDLFVKLLDVSPDGAAINITGPGQEAMRVSYRNQTATRDLLSPGQVVKLDFENVRTGNVFKKGHMLRVCVCSSWFPLYSRNLQTGGLESESGVTRTATIYIHHELDHQSKIILPVIPTSTK